MRRLALVLATAWLSACTLAGPRAGARPADAVAGPTEEPEVRVGVVVDVPTLEVAGSADVELVDGSGRVRSRGSGPWTVEADGEGVAFRGAGERLRVDGPVVVRPRQGRVRVDGVAYRGAVLVRRADAGVTAVNLLDLETYLLGVVPKEIGAGRPAEEVEAVKAQAIAARTYAIRHLGRRESLGFDFYGSVQDQAYGGLDVEDPVASRAVRETRGEILVYDGEPVEAFYHSTCGGRTAALHEVWDGDPRPYLESVSDRRPDGGWYCETSNRFRWTEQWDEAKLLDILSRTLGEDAGAVTRVESMEILDRTPSGRVARLRIRTDIGETLVGGDSVRRVLRPAPGRLLNSSAIDIDTHGEDRVRELVVEGAGWGHGIGMCQVGALGRARAGQSYRDILLTYYPDTRIARLY